jgi:hypothetical protein
MKLKLLTLLALVILLFNQCKKDQNFTALGAKEAFTEKAKQYLTKQMPAEDFNKLDWSKTIVYEKDGQYIRLKIPLTGNQAATDKAVYLKYDKDVFTGNYFSIDKPVASSETITTLSLDNVNKCVAQLTPAQTIKSYQKYEQGRLVYDSQNGISPNTAIIRMVRTYINSAGQIYIWMSMLGAGQPGSGDPLTLQQLDNMGTLDYLSSDPSISDPSGGIGEIIEEEYVDGDSKPAVDIVKLFKCFDDLPDLPGTTYELTLNTDVPFNSYPGLAHDFVGSPGHTYITIKKTNGTQSVTQNFGFYPVSGFASAFLGNVSSKIVNDQYHEANAQLKKQINQNEFTSIRSNAIVWAGLQYNLENNNCTDFALKLFNLTRPNNPIILTPFHVVTFIPSTFIPLIFDMNNAPQTLFAVLKDRKTTNSPDAPNISIDQTHNTEAPSSKGECN